MKLEVKPGAIVNTYLITDSETGESYTLIDKYPSLYIGIRILNEDGDRVKPDSLSDEIMEAVEEYKNRKGNHIS